MRNITTPARILGSIMIMHLLLIAPLPAASHDTATGPAIAQAKPVPKQPKVYTPASAVVAKVTAATAKLSGSNPTGNNSMTYKFTGTITTNSPKTVTYRWLLIGSQTQAGPTKTVTVSAAGNHPVADNILTFGMAPTTQHLSVALEILTPNALQSGKVDFVVPAMQVEQTLARAEMVFNTKGENKAAKTGVYVDVTAGGKTIARVENGANTVEYAKNSANTLNIPIIGSVKKSECANPGAKLIIKSADTWRFYATLKLYYSDGTQTSITSPNERILLHMPPVIYASWMDLMGPPIGGTSTGGGGTGASATSAPTTGKCVLLFGKTGGPQDRIQGLDVWTAGGLGATAPFGAVVTSVKNISKYPVTLGEEYADVSVTPTRYQVKNKVRLAQDQATPAFAGRTNSVRWVIFATLPEDPSEGKPQIEISWKK